MELRDAIRARFSVRAFTDQPVDREVLERVLAEAAYAPSGGNLQPWHIIVLTGDSLQALKDRMTTRLSDDPTPDAGGFEGYPSPLKSPYRDRRFRCGMMLYEALGIAREDRPARIRQFELNYRFFDAPAAMLCYLDEQMNPLQYADTGMFLQTLMLLLTDAGLGSCPQAAWANFPHTVAEVVQPPPEWVLLCGIAIGHPDTDHPVNRFRTERATPAEYARFLD